MTYQDNGYKPRVGCTQQFSASGGASLGQAPDYYGVFTSLDNGTISAGYDSGVAGQKFSLAMNYTAGNNTASWYWLHPSTANWAGFSNPGSGGTGWAIGIANPDDSFPSVGQINIGADPSDPPWTYLIYNADADNKAKGYKTGLVEAGTPLTTANWNPWQSGRRWWWSIADAADLYTVFIFDNYVLTSGDVSILESGWTP